MRMGGGGRGRERTRATPGEAERQRETAGSVAVGECGDGGRDGERWKEGGGRE